CHWIPWLRSNETCLLTLLITGLALATVKAVSDFLLARSAQEAAERTAASLRLDLERQATRLGSSNLLDQPRPSILELFGGRTELIRESLADHWRLLPLALFQAGGCLLVASLIDPWLALAGVLLGAVSWSLWIVYRRRVTEHQQILAEEADQQFADLESHLAK